VLGRRAPLLGEPSADGFIEEFQQDERLTQRAQYFGSDEQPKSDSVQVVGPGEVAEWPDQRIMENVKKVGEFAQKQIDRVASSASKAGPGDHGA
jgi:hypothetical protein